MTITLEEARAYLASLGIVLPDFMLQLLVDTVNAIGPCVEANYPAGVAKLIMCYYLGVFAIVQGDKYVSSQTAPSGASQSFRYNSLSDRYRAQVNLLQALDTAGCATPIPADPTQGAAAFFVSKGGCC